MEELEGFAACGPWGGKISDNGDGEWAWSGNKRGFLGLLSLPLLLLPHHHLRSSGNEGFGLVRVAPQRAQLSANQGLLSKAGPFETNSNFHHVTPQELIASPCM